jgi:hypothetical protein
MARPNPPLAPITKADFRAILRISYFEITKELLNTFLVRFYISSGAKARVDFTVCGTTEVVP